MTEQTKVTTLEKVVVRFSGDSGDGMQLTGTIFSNLSAVFGNEISTFPDYPAEVRAPQGTLSGVSGFQVHLGSKKIFTPGEKADVLVAMNPAALKVNVKHIKPNAIVLIDTDSFQKSDLEKALYTTDDPFKELGLTQVQVVAAPISTMVRDGLTDFGLDNKSALRCKNMFALGLVCWLFERPLDEAMHMLQNKFAKKPVIAQANIKALTDGYNYGHNIHASVSTYRIESKKALPGTYMDVNGNKATSYGLIAAAEKAGLRLFLGSYPITPATDILHELSKRKDLGVITVQAEDEIAGVCTAIGASFAGCLAATSTSGPGLALKSEAIGLAVIAEVPLVVIDVQRVGPSTGQPTSPAQGDIMQARWGTHGDHSIIALSPWSVRETFDVTVMAVNYAERFRTPVILLMDEIVGHLRENIDVPEKDDIEIYPRRQPKMAPSPEYKAYTPDTDLVPNIADFGKGYHIHVTGLIHDETGFPSGSPMVTKEVIDRLHKKIDIARDEICHYEAYNMEDAQYAIVSYGGTARTAYEAMLEARKKSYKVGMVRLITIWPFADKVIADLADKVDAILVPELNYGQLVHEVQRASEGKCKVEFLGKYDTQIFTPAEIETAIIKMCEGGNN